MHSTRRIVFSKEDLETDNRIEVVLNFPNGQKKMLVINDKDIKLRWLSPPQVAKLTGEEHLRRRLVAYTLPDVSSEPLEKFINRFAALPFVKRRLLDGLNTFLTEHYVGKKLNCQNRTTWLIGLWLTADPKGLEASVSSKQFAKITFLFSGLRKALQDRVDLASGKTETLYR